MLTWLKFDGGPLDWDALLIQASDHNIFQSYGWGEYKRPSNWLPVRYKCIDKLGKVVCLVQILIKKLPLGLYFLWSPGAPVVGFPTSSSFKLSDIFPGLLELLNRDYPRSVIRLHNHTRTDATKSFELNKLFRRPYVRLNTGFTIFVDLSQISAEDFRKQMTAKHRYYVKKAGNSALTWKIGNDPDLMTNLKLLHNQMVTDKNLASLSLSATDLNAMYEQLRENILIVQGSLDSQPAVTCLILIFGSNAFYMVAAANALGRQNSASYAMVERLASELSDRGVQSFDFGGVDPVSQSAAGVNHFKFGFGGILVEQGGEWEYSKSQLLRFVVNCLIGFKGGRT